MSTAGKVLSVLVTLMAVVWILLVATVAQLNRNGTKAVEDLQTQVAKLEADVARTDREVQQTKDQTHTLQRVTQNDLTVLQARQADTEKKRTLQLETTTRVRLQLTDAETMIKSAEVDRKHREEEKEAETKALAETRSSVEKLKGENAQLLARLTSLRGKFKATLKDNKSMVERLNRSGGERRTKPASLSR